MGAMFPPSYASFYLTRFVLPCSYLNILIMDTYLVCLLLLYCLTSCNTMSHLHFRKFPLRSMLQSQNTWKQHQFNYINWTPMSSYPSFLCIASKEASFSYPVPQNLHDMYYRFSSTQFFFLFYLPQKAYTYTYTYKHIKYTYTHTNI